MSIISYQKQPRYPFVIAAVSSLMDMYIEFFTVLSAMHKIEYTALYITQYIDYWNGSTW